MVSSVNQIVEFESQIAQLQNQVNNMVKEATQGNKASGSLDVDQITAQIDDMDKKFAKIGALLMFQATGNHESAQKLAKQTIQSIIQRSEAEP